MDRSLKMTWSSPSDKGGYTIDRYNLMFAIQGSIYGSVVKNAVSGHVIENLVNGEEYSININAIIYAKNGIRSRVKWS